MKKILIIAGVLLTILSSGVRADADNYTAINGTGCQAYFAGDKAFFENNFSGIRNVGTIARVVSCPLNKDVVSAVGGRGTTWVRWNGTGTLSCTINHWNVNMVNTFKSASRTGTGWLNIPADTSDDFWGSMTLWCTLPAGGTLQTIHYLEN